MKWLFMAATIFLLASCQKENDATGSSSGIFPQRSQAPFGSSDDANANGSLRSNGVAFRNFLQTNYSAGGQQTDEKKSSLRNNK